MFAELLNLENNRTMRQLLQSYPHKPFNWALVPGQENSQVDYITDSIRKAVESGGIAKTYNLGGTMVGLCVVRPDQWASRELSTRTYQIDHLIATGSPETRTLIKAMLLRETMRNIIGKVCFVTQVPYTDLASINALERMGFTATQTSLVMARDLSHHQSSARPEEIYEVQQASADDVDSILQETAGQIPTGIFGWDSRLPRSTMTKVYRDWLRNYASEQGLLLAQDRGRTVGLLAERIHSDATQFLGFSVGSIALIATIPEYRNNGVASQLMADSLHQFRNQGVRLAEVVAYAADTPTVQCCQSQGFVTVESTLTMVNWRN